VHRVLFVHNGGSGRFRFLAEALRGRGWTGALLNMVGSGSALPGFKTLDYAPVPAEPSGPFGLVTRKAFEAGRAAAASARQLKHDGFIPDVIIGHPGWGEMLFLREIFPTSPQIQIAEFYYRSRGADVNFDPEFDKPSFDRDIRVHGDNAFLTLSLSEADRIVAPTHFQADLFPAIFRPRMQIIHEGIDTALARRLDDPVIELKRCTLRRGDRVVTFINRYFEPLRGIHIFMRALPRLLAADPDVHVLMIGSKASKGYGVKPGRESWFDRLVREVGPGIDWNRVHCVGTLDYPTLTRCLSLSSAHVYWTYPFVLSWSLLDAMACECVVIGSDTAPVREVIDSGRNGVLIDFFDPAGLSDMLIETVAAPERFSAMRAAARQTVETEFDRAQVCVPAWLSLIDDVMDGDVRGMPQTSTR
jgi:glycosyltransferase involved in cell wall biosynthesis